VKTGSAGDLASVLAALKRRLWVVALVLFMALGAAYLLSERQEEQFQAESTLLFRDPGLDQQVVGLPGVPPGDSERNAETNVGLVGLDVVRRAAARSLGRENGELPGNGEVAVAPKGASDLVSVTATANDADLAARIANAATTGFVRLRRDTARDRVAQAERRARGELDSLANASKARRRQLRDNIQSLQLLRSVQTGNVEVVQRATVPGEAFAPKLERTLLIGGLAGLLLGLAIALVVEALDRRVRRTGELAELVGVPVLATVPRSSALRWTRRQRRRAAKRNGDGGMHLGSLPAREAEAFRLLLANLRHSDFGREIRVLAVTSPSPGTGKSTVAMQLAATAADAALTALLIEADTRRPTLSSRLGGSAATEEDGLTALLRDPQVGLATQVRRVSVLAEPGGDGDEASSDGDETDDGRELMRQGAEPARAAVAFDALVTEGEVANPTRLFDSRPMAELLATAAGAYDLVILDLPPFGVSEAVPLMKLADGVLVVSRVGDETREAADRLRAELGRLDVAPIGVVANFAPDGDDIYYAPAERAAQA